MLKKILKAILLIVFITVIGCRVDINKEITYKKTVEKRKIGKTVIELEQTAFYAGGGDWLITTDVEMDGDIRIYYRPSVSEMVYNTDCAGVEKELKRQLEIMEPKFEKFYDKAMSVISERDIAKQCIEEIE